MATYNNPTSDTSNGWQGGVVGGAALTSFVDGKYVNPTEAWQVRVNQGLQQAPVNDLGSGTTDPNYQNGYYADALSGQKVAFDPSNPTAAKATALQNQDKYFQTQFGLEKDAQGNWFEPSSTINSAQSTPSNFWSMTPQAGQIQQASTDEGPTMRNAQGLSGLSFAGQTPEAQKAYQYILDRTPEQYAADIAFNTAERNKNLASSPISGYMSQINPNWQSLPADQLDVLRQMATNRSQGLSTYAGIDPSTYKPTPWTTSAQAQTTPTQPAAPTHDLYDPTYQQSSWDQYIASKPQVSWDQFSQGQNFNNFAKGQATQQAFGGFDEMSGLRASDMFLGKQSNGMTPGTSGAAVTPVAQTILNQQTNNAALGALSSYLKNPGSGVTAAQLQPVLDKILAAAQTQIYAPGTQDRTTTQGRIDATNKLMGSAFGFDYTGALAKQQADLDAARANGTLTNDWWKQYDTSGKSVLSQLANYLANPANLRNINGTALQQLAGQSGQGALDAIKSWDASPQLQAVTGGTQGALAAMANHAV